MENKPETKVQGQSPGLQPHINPKGGRPRVKHGGFAYLAKGKVTGKRQRHIQLYLDAARQGLVDDLSGGQGECALPAAKIVLIDRALAVLGILRLIEEYVAEKGIIAENGELTPPLGSSYISYHNTLRQTLALLGVDRRKGVNDETLERYIKRKYPLVQAATPTKPAQAPAAAAAALKLEGKVETACQSEIVDPGASGKGI